MKTSTKLMAVGAAAVMAVGSAAMALETPLQTILDTITTSPAGNSSVTVATDVMADQADWMTTLGINDPAAVVSTLVIEIAGYAGGNQFGIYNTGNTAQRVTVFNGSDGAGAQVNVAVPLAWSGLGFFLQSQPGQIFYSNSALNPSGYQNMWAFQGVGDMIDTKLATGASNGYVGQWGANGFILGWEDIEAGQNDGDHNDMVVFVQGRSTKVPDAGATLALLGLALTGIGMVGRKSR